EDGIRYFHVTGVQTCALPISDEYGIVGYCWGGSTSFAHATRDPELDAAVVYYGSSPDAAALRNVPAPVLGLYGGDDARVNATVPDRKSVVEGQNEDGDHCMKR